MGVMKDPMTMVKIFIKLARVNPKIAINHFLCLSSFVWRPDQPKDVYLETVVFDNFDFRQTPQWEKYKDIVNQHSFLPVVRKYMQKAVEFEWHWDPNRILWRPAIFMYLFLTSLIFLTIRTRKWSWLLLALPLAMQSIVIMLTLQLEALRYQYPVYLISMLFTIPLFIMALINPRLRSNPESYS
jgi:hypothetical protein